MLSTINLSLSIYYASWIDIKRHNWLCGRFTPLSDPLATGPNIQHSTQVALKIVPDFTQAVGQFVHSIVIALKTGQ
jgi:hypothetical protein